MGIIIERDGVTREVKRGYLGVNDLAVKIYDEDGDSPVKVRVMTVKIDQSNSDPTSWATYADDAEGMEAGSSEWDDFFGHYPCILEDGEELGKLDPDNFAKYADGTDAPINTLGKDVMICYPRMGLKIETEGDVVSVSMTNQEDAEGYTYWAHTYKGEACDKFYLGAYKGFVSSNALYSISGQSPTTNVSITNFRTYAQARGTGYEQSAHFQRTFTQAMYLLKYKGQNGQIAVGRGFVDGNSAKVNTGGTNAYGMDYGETTGKVQMKLLGQEDYWGNVYEFIDGLWSNSSKQLQVSDGTNYADTSTYMDAGTPALSNNRYYNIYKVNGSNLAGFTPDFSNGNGATTYTTYWCDYGGVYASYFATAGGNWDYGDFAGPFRVFVYYGASEANSNVGGRLAYLHKK